LRIEEGGLRIGNCYIEDSGLIEGLKD